jgi:hypothetical protein
VKRAVLAVLGGVFVAGLAAAGVGLASSGPAGSAAVQPPSAANSGVTPPTPTAPLPSASPPEPTADARVVAIGDEQWKRIVETRTWRPGCPAGRAQLRRLEVNHWDFQGKVRRGVLVVNADVAIDLAGMFTELFDSGFPIARMQPVEQFGGDVYKSLSANNTSAWNCRRPGQINAPVKDSPHANGRAVDINPVQNPWRDPRCDCWVPSARFARTTTGPGVIRENSPVVSLFESNGWIWQNIKVPDYMHFDSGYPSRPVKPQAPTASD